MYNRAMPRKPAILVMSAAALLAGVALTARTRAQQPSAITFNKDIAPILWQHCATCHRPGQLGPFSLMTYGDARPRAREILRVVQMRRMPPWKPDPGHGDFVGVRRLSDAQIALIVRWVEGGSRQ